MNAVYVGLLTIGLFIGIALLQKSAEHRRRSRQTSKGMKKYWEKNPRKVVKQSYNRIYARGYYAGKRKSEGRITVKDGGKVVTYMNRNGLPIWE